MHVHSLFNDSLAPLSRFGNLGVLFVDIPELGSVSQGYVSRPCFWGVFRGVSFGVWFAPFFSGKKIFMRSTVCFGVCFAVSPKLSVSALLQVEHAKKLQTHMFNHLEECHRIPIRITVDGCNIRWIARKTVKRSVLAILLLAN